MTSYLTNQKHMGIALYTLTSPLHDEAAVNNASAAFIKDIESALGADFIFRGPDFTGFGTHDLDVIYVRTGGTEGIFKEVYPLVKGHVHILTSGKSNSLAASMEILSFLRQQGRSGEIIHGNVEYIAQRISLLAKTASARKALNGTNLGIIGQPSDWLISSNADTGAVMKRLGVDLVEIPIGELVSEIKAVSCADLPEQARAVKEKFEASAPKALARYEEGAFRIYAALKNIIARYSLSGLTLRCFDLLTAVGNTGCLALAILGSEGIPAGCEGDVPALLSMAIGKALTGVCGFQSNPSRIDPEKGEIVAAHCTIPLNMVSRYGFNTHFESGIGIAVCGCLPTGDATIFKVSGDLSRHFACEAELTDNLSEKDLCRTQIVLKVPDKDVCRDYFLRNPIGNHHVVFPGHCKALFEAFMESLS